MFVAAETPGRHPSSVRSGMFGGQCAASAVVPMFQAVPLLLELVSVQNGFNYRRGAPDGAFAGLIPPQTARFGLPASLGPLPARSGSTPPERECAPLAAASALLGRRFVLQCRD
jgi:hypothetical protein